MADLHFVNSLSKILLEAEDLFADVLVPVCPWCLVHRMDEPPHAPDCALEAWRKRAREL